MRPLPFVVLVLLLVGCNAQPPAVVEERFRLVEGTPVAGQAVSVEYRLRANSPVLSSVRFTADGQTIFLLESSSPQEQLGVTFPMYLPTSGEYIVYPIVSLISGTEVITRVGQALRIDVLASPSLTSPDEMALDIRGETPPESFAPESSSPESSTTASVPLPTDVVATAPPTAVPDAIQTTPTPAPTENRYVVAAEVLNVREAPGKNAPLRFRLKSGETVYLLEKQTTDLEWGRIKTETGEEGWVALQFIRPLR